MVCVRAFEPADAQQASEILVAAFKVFLQDRFDRTLAAHFQPDALIQGACTESRFMVSRMFVAESGNDIVGVVKVTARDNGLGMLDFIGVDPESHARGIGALLMARAEEFWAEHDQRKIETNVSAHNKKTLMYYLKHDFIPEGYCRDHFREGVDEIILGRFLRKKN